MNIEIKFRAWDKRRLKMYRVKHIYLTEGSLLTRGIVRRTGTDDDEVMLCLEDASIMQYTGLKDKNGNEIYEGDILRVEGEKDLYFDLHIIFKHGCFGYVSSGREFVALGRNHHYFDLTESSEQSHCLIVIGNIWENPELLKEMER